MGATAFERDSEHSGAVVTLTFRHLYDNVWGAVRKPRYKWERPKLIMPDGFIPEKGEKYKCILHQTRMGDYVFEGVHHELWFAKLVDAGTIIDKIDYTFDKEREQSFGSPFARLELVRKRDELPEKHEVLNLKAAYNRKTKRLWFEPQYLDSDPYAGAGVSSMRIFVCDELQMKKVKENKQYRVRVDNHMRTRKSNKRGAVIVMVFVTIL